MEGTPPKPTTPPKPDRLPSALTIFLNAGERAAALRALQQVNPDRRRALLAVLGLGAQA